MNGFFLSLASFERLPDDARAAILAEFGLSRASLAGEEAEPLAPGSNDSLARLNERQVRRLIQKPLAENSRKLLEAAAALEPRFRISDLLEKMGLQSYPQIKGPLSGLTRRTRTILNDPEVWLFLSVEDRDPIEDGIARMHPETHAALRKVLNAGA